MPRLALAAVGLALPFAVSCGSSETPAPPDVAVDAGPELPPAICKTPSDPPLPWFHEVTGEVGLAKTADLEPLASCLVSADLDADGFADLVAMRGDSARGLVDGKRVRFLMMNRPSPSDPAARVLVDVPDQAGLLATREGTLDRGASIALLGDLNGDGAVDIVTCPSDFTVNAEMKDPCAAFLNDGAGHFTLAPPSDIDAKPYPVTSAVLLDYDRDGILDFWPAGMAHWFAAPGSKWKTGPRLFRGNGDGTFAEVTAQVGLPTKEGSVKEGKTFRHTFGMTSCDLDGDGDQDVLLASYGRQENQVWRNDGGQFVEVAHALGLDHDDREDYSDDESYRCYCATHTCTPAPPAPELDCKQFGGQYLRGWIPGVTDQPYGLGGNNFGVACNDIDDDGDMDVLFATIVHGDVGTSSDPTEICENPGDGGKFVRPGNEVTGLERPEQGFYWNHGDNMPTFVDVDLDGRQDLFLTSTVYPDSHPWFWRQLPDGTFAEVGEQAGIRGADGHPIAQGVDFVDLDGDGDLDLLTGTAEDPAAVHAYRNDVGQDSNWLRLRLIGKGPGFSNPSAIGARVRVTAGGRTQTREVKGGQGIGNMQHDLVLTFGLGAACEIDEVEVRWPDAAGTVTTYSGVRANYVVTVREGEPDVSYPPGSVTGAPHG